MFQKILVCLDRTRQAEQIIPYACAQVRNSGGKLLLLLVCKRDFYTYDITPSGQLVYAPVNLIEKSLEQSRNKGVLYLRRIANKLSRLGIDADPLVIEAGGTLAESIVACAESESVDLIAMASKGRSGIGRLLFGSVSTAVARKARVPVLIVAPDGRKELGDPVRIAELGDGVSTQPPAADNWSEELDPSSALSGS